MKRYLYYAEGALAGMICIMLYYDGWHILFSSFVGTATGILVREIIEFIIRRMFNEKE